MALFSEISKKECAKERYPHSTVKIWFVQHCAAISVIAEVLFVYYCVYKTTCVQYSAVEVMQVDSEAPDH